MLKDITLGQYFPGNSVIHRLDPRTKLIMLVVYIVALFMAVNWVSYAVMAAFLVIVVKISTIPPKSIIRGCPSASTGKGGSCRSATLVRRRLLYRGKAQDRNASRAGKSGVAWQVRLSRWRHRPGKCRERNCTSTPWCAAFRWAMKLPVIRAISSRSRPVISQIKCMNIPPSNGLPEVGFLIVTILSGPAV